MAKRNQSGRFNTICIVAILIVLSIVMVSRMVELNRQSEEYAMQEEQLVAQVAAQEERKQELASLEEDMQTMKFIEKVAREKLGLLYPDEIIFREKNN